MPVEHVHVICVACHELITLPSHIISKSASHHHIELQVTVVQNVLAASVEPSHTVSNEEGANVGTHDTPPVEPVGSWLKGFPSIRIEPPSGL